MSELFIHPSITYEFHPVKLELFQPMDAILFHFIENNGRDLEGYNLFTIDLMGLNFKLSVNTGLRSLDLDDEKGRILKVVGVDLL